VIDVESERAELERRFRTVETRLCIADHELTLLHPASAEDLIDEDDFERDSQRRDFQCGDHCGANPIGTEGREIPAFRSS